MAFAMLIMSLICGSSAVRQAEAAGDHVGIRQALLDYAEGYYDHVPERMTRAISPVLTKRALMARPGLPSFLIQMNSEMLIEATRGTAPRPNATERKLAVEVLDVSGNIASARVFSVQFNDYVHLIKRDGRWTLLNVLWHPPVSAPATPAAEAVKAAAREYAAALVSNDSAKLVAVTSAVAALRTLSASGVIVDRNVESTAAAIATRTLLAGDGAVAVTVLGTDGDIASVKVGNGPTAAYVHLALQNGKWLVVNALTAVAPR